MSYAALEAHEKRLYQLLHAEAMLSWDEATMMPVEGGEARAQCLSTLRGVMHAAATAPGLAELFVRAEDELAENSLELWQAANLREMKRDWVRKSALPQDLVEASSLAKSRSEQAWRQLRLQNDWKTFRPLLEEVVSLERQVAQALSERLGLDPYDALVDGYEPGMKSAQIAPLFTELEAFLPGFTEQVLEKQAREEPTPLAGSFAVERQKWLARELMQRAGFDFKRGRLDASHHPFCGGVPEDVRITTRYDPASFLSALMGVMHETGHAKYEQNLPRRWVSQPVGRARGMAVHESQSLLLEMQVCRSRQFLQLATPLFREAFPDAMATNSAALELENLYRVQTRVHPGRIRVDADEVTYPCHVIFRFEIERGLILGKLSVSDIPEVWNLRMQELLGIRTEGDFANGCLQDVHWPAGLFGYFPSYTLGALIAAQLFQAAQRDVPLLLHGVAQGDFVPLDRWLNQKIWSLGSTLSTSQLVEQATGAPLGATAFTQHLRDRYLCS